MKGLPVITVSYQYGSRGKEIAKGIAEALGVALYDNDALDSQEAENGVQDLHGVLRAECGGRLYALATGTEEGRLISGACRLPDGDLKFYSRIAAMGTLAKKGSAVLLGDGCEPALAELSRCVHVFVVADRSVRIRNVAEAERVSLAEAQRRVEKHDRRSALHCDFYTGERWGEPRRYSLCINSGILGIDGSVSTVCAAVESMG